MKIKYCISYFVIIKVQYSIVVKIIKNNERFVISLQKHETISRSITVVKPEFVRISEDSLLYTLKKKIMNSIKKTLINSLGNTTCQSKIS